jgi:hypothetical protein
MFVAWSLTKQVLVVSVIAQTAGYRSGGEMWSIPSGDATRLCSSYPRAGCLPGPRYGRIDTLVEQSLS